MNEKKTAREELWDKIAEKSCEVSEILTKYLPSDVRMRYVELTSRIEELKEHLRTHDDEYLEKDRAFDWSRCPRNTPIDSDEPCLAEAQNFKECSIKECPEFPTCELKGKPEIWGEI